MYRLPFVTVMAVNGPKNSYRIECIVDLYGIVVLEAGRYNNFIHYPQKELSALFILMVFSFLFSSPFGSLGAIRKQSLCDDGKIAAAQLIMYTQYVKVLNDNVIPFTNGLAACARSLACSTPFPWLR